ncbi:MAG: hypothetical protein F2837_00260 [Actinobacteria bacterium]|nr:hypothetical protein [Actinomycetota bacterium]
MTSTLPVQQPPRISPRLVRRAVLGVFVGGIISMIVSSILDSTGGAITFGLVTAVAAIALVLVTSVSPPGALAKPGSGSATDIVDDRVAADLEERITSLVDAGADEDQVRRLVSRSIEYGRGGA